MIFFHLSVERTKTYVDCDTLVGEENDVVYKHNDLREADKLYEGPGPLLNKGAVPLPVAQLGFLLLSPGGDRDDNAHGGLARR